MGSRENPSSCPLIRKSLIDGNSDLSDEVRLVIEDGWVENEENWREADEGREDMLEDDAV
jgi:hypothetical protein